jgi:hypothetical protein
MIADWQGGRLMLVSEDTIHAHIQNWIGQNKEELVRAYCRRADWDSWAQAALANQLRCLPGTPHIQTRQHTCDNGAKVLPIKIT